MKVFITGEKGFIATNLNKYKSSGIEVITGIHEDNDEAAFVSQYVTDKGEPCIHRNKEDAWQAFFEVNDIDVVIHNAAVVGTDVVALNSKESTLTNVQGTYNICRAAKKAGIPVCYIGTTVIYDTQQFQEDLIKEDSARGPTTLYGCQKLCSEDIVKSQSDKWMIVRPLFAYGGDGDMNSLIAKTIYSTLNNKEQIDMFLDPNKVKDYMHVSDFCRGVWTCIQNELWYNDLNIASENPYTTWEIVKIIEDVIRRDISNVIKWHPQTDYLGNHRLTSQKLKSLSTWEPQISLRAGIKMSYESILNSKDYNPLMHLEEAEDLAIDLTEFFPDIN
jgi:nucleoside-diphosphate-sugar epimerase